MSGASRLSGLLALLGCLAVLPVLVHASPPDPLWIPGFYDDGDHDDVVQLLNVLMGWLAPDAVPVVKPALVIAPTPGGAPQAPQAPVVSGTDIRAPPLV